MYLIHTIRIHPNNARTVLTYQLRTLSVIVRRHPNSQNPTNPKPDQCPARLAFE